MINLFPCISSKPKETINECAGRVVKNNLVTVNFGNREYKVTVKNNHDVTVTRQDKTWYKSVGDIFARGFTRGQKAFTPRALQLQKAIQAEWIKAKQNINECFADSSTEQSIPDRASQAISDSMTGRFSQKEIIAKRNALRKVSPEPKLFQQRTSPEPKLSVEKTCSSQPSSDPQVDENSSCVEKQTEELFSRLNTTNKGPKKKLCAETSNSLYTDKAGPYLPDEVCRFSDVLAMAATAVDPGLHANKITINDKIVAIASQYPKTEQIKTHLRMMANKKTPALVVLSTKKEIVKSYAPGCCCLPDYFSNRNPYSKQNKIYNGGKNSVILGKAKESVSESGQQNLLINDSYNLKLKNSNNEDITIPVQHVTNWPDRETIPLDTLINLLNLIITTVKDKLNEYKEQGVDIVQDMVPVIHCKAGVGRTGVIIAALALRLNPTMSLQEVIEIMRASRNNKMVQTYGQLRTLVQFCLKEDYEILRTSEAGI
ncbi:protein-tyrosine phosphatase family protein [Kalamiella sp. sgz302252]|uniref:protein-tyrosine phosphatase family protein n=1 Tax=Pantoea sp. sgz302252 TaxID=3341827 RepID=UPI0036D40B73